MPIANVSVAPREIQSPQIVCKNTATGSRNAESHHTRIEYGRSDFSDSTPASPTRPRLVIESQPHHSAAEDPITNRHVLRIRPDKKFRARFGAARARAHARMSPSHIPGSCAISPMAIISNDYQKLKTDQTKIRTLHP